MYAICWSGFITLTVLLFVTDFQALTCVCHVCHTYGPRLHACLSCIYFGCLKQRHIHKHASERNHPLGELKVVPDPCWVRIGNPFHNVFMVVWHREPPSQCFHGYLTYSMSLFCLLDCYIIVHSVNDIMQVPLLTWPFHSMTIPLSPRQTTLQPYSLCLTRWCWCDVQILLMYLPKVKVKHQPNLGTGIEGGLFLGFGGHQLAWGWPKLPSSATALDLTHGYVYCFECNDYTYNWTLRKICRRNKVLAAKSLGESDLLGAVVCPGWDDVYRSGVVHLWKQSFSADLGSFFVIFFGMRGWLIKKCDRDQSLNDGFGFPFLIIPICSDVWVIVMESSFTASLPGHKFRPGRSLWVTQTSNAGLIPASFGKRS